MLFLFSRALNYVAGHEITHILEGTELYTELQTMLKAVAESKGEYQSRYDEISKLYEGVEGANIEQELTADLVGDYLFTDREFIKRLSTEKPGVFKKIYNEIKYLCKVATAGSKEARELEKVKKTFEELYRESRAEKNTAEGGVRYSLNIRYSNGTVEELADARTLTEEQALSYLKQAKSGELRRNSYIPVRKDTPQVIIDALKQVGENVDNLSLVMSVNKARQAMSNKDKSGVSKNKSDNIRGHSLKPEEILEIIKGLDEPSLMIYQTERYDKYGKELPNNVAVFVEFNNGEKEGMAVVEFDSEFDSDAIGNEYGDTNYHTVVTVFKPDTIRDGNEFDYAQELLENPKNIELEIRRRQLNESATGEKHPNTFEESPSSIDSIPNSPENVKQKDVFGFKINENADVDEDLLEELSIYHPDAEVDSEGNVTVYHRTSKANAEKIRKTGIMTALEDALFFSSKSEGYASDYGDTVLTFKIPSTVLRVNDIFDGEVHFDVPLKRMNNQWSMNVSKYLVDEGTAESYSLSSKDTTPKKHGDYAVYGEDVMFEKDDLAPVKETTEESSATVSETEQVEPTAQSNVPTVNEDDYAPMTEAEANAMYEADKGYINTFTDADMPPETDAPMSADVKNDLLSRSAESFGITKPGDYVQVQRQVFDTLEKEGFFSDEGSRSRTVTNSDSSMQVEINKKGIKETFNYDNYGKQGIRKKAMKLATVRMLPQIIENGKLVSDDVDNYHNSESSNKFAYIEAEVHVEGQPVSVKIDIKKSPQKNKFWVHSVYIKEKVDGLPADTSRVLKRANEHIDSIESISNADENVNSEEPVDTTVIKTVEDRITAKIENSNGAFIYFYPFTIAHLILL